MESLRPLHDSPGIQSAGLGVAPGQFPAQEQQLLPSSVGYCPQRPWNRGVRNGGRATARCYVTSRQAQTYAWREQIKVWLG